MHRQRTCCGASGAATWPCELPRVARTGLASLSTHPLRVNSFCPCPQPTVPAPLQHKYKGEEVDFVESYFFPTAKTVEAQLQQRRQQRRRQQAGDER